MRTLHLDVEQRAAGVGVDFDELRSIRCDVKVEAKEHTAVRRRVLRNRRCACEHLLAKGRQASDRFDRADHALHFARVLLRHEYRDMARTDADAIRARVELLPQGRQVGSRAIAFAVETVGERDGVSHAAALCSASRRNSIAPVTAPASCAAMNPGASAGRMPAKLSVSERPSVIAGFANEVEAVNQ